MWEFFIQTLSLPGGQVLAAVSINSEISSADGDLRFASDIRAWK